MIIETRHLGAPPVGLIEKSREVVENIAIFGSCAYDTYQMLDGISHYSGTVDYASVVLQ